VLACSVPCCFKPEQAIAKREVILLRGESGCDYLTEYSIPPSEIVGKIEPGEKFEVTGVRYRKSAECLMVKTRAGQRGYVQNSREVLEMLR